ncbi:MAG: alanine racemase [Bacilli bacterium]|nr:alanine racemase [Bacilli bacterium]
MISFTPKLNDEAREVLNNKELLLGIGENVGYPYSIILPNAIKDNINSFKSVFYNHKLNYKIFFAHKCNKSSEVIKECLKNNINVDVSSLNELRHTLENGYTGNNILATGPKNKEFIKCAIENDCIISIDSLCELETIINISNKLNKITEILIRINNADSNMVRKSSRFGLDNKELGKSLELIQINNNINLIGIAMHFDTVNIKEKVNGINRCIKIIDKLLSFGFDIKVLDIGGGYKLNYLDNKEEYQRSISKIKENIITGNEELVWNNYTFGLNVENNTLKGTFNSYDFYDDNVKDKYLDSILNSEIDGRNISEIINDYGLEIWIEPGRSLLDNVGLNISRVNFVKEVDNKTLVGIEMNKNQMLMGDNEIFIDPIILNNEEKIEFFMIGNLCLENDFIFKRKLFLNKPRIDDLIVFVNTAGYYMDFEESESIMHDKKTKVVIRKGENGFNYYIDN